MMPPDDPPETAETPPLAERTSKRRPAVDALGEQRPRFLLEFPDDPELETLMMAFEQGDFAKVRAEAEALARRTENDAVRRAALELRRRIDPDPLLVSLLGLCLALFAAVVIWVYAQ